MSQTSDQTQQLVQQALHEFEEQAVADKSPGEVFPQMLQTLVRTTQGLGAIAWLRNPNAPEANPFQAVGHAGRGAAMVVDNNGQPHAPVLNLLRQVMEQEKSIAVGPDQQTFISTPLHQTTQFYVPVQTPGKVMGLLQLICPAELDPKVYRQYVAFTQQAARTAGNYLLGRQNRLLHEEASHHIAIGRLSQKMAACIDPNDFIHELANQARPLLEAQRVCVVSAWGPSGSVACSDVIEVNRRAVLVRAVEMLADAVRQSDTPMSFRRDQTLEGQEQALDPLLEDLWRMGNAQAVCLTPIRSQKQVLGVLVAEYENAEQTSRHGAMQQLMAQHMGPLLEHALHWQQRPLRRLGDLIESIRSQPRKHGWRAGIALTLLAVAWWTICIMPVPLTFKAEARLEPRRMAIIASPLAGQIMEVQVGTSQPVLAGQVVAKMDTADLEKELAETIQKIQQEQVSMRKALGDGDAASWGASAKQIEALEIHRQRLISQIQRCSIRSPADGVVLTEQGQLRLLQGRTVAEGEALIQVADLSAFDLIIEIPEEDLTLIEDQLNREKKVLVTFLSRAWPDKPQQASIQSLYSLAPTSSPDAKGVRHIYRVSLPVELTGMSPQLVLANPTGRAKVEVGSSSLAWRYGRGVWRFLQMTLLF